MLKLFISQVKNLLKFTIALKEGNIEKAAAFYAEYKKASDASEIAVQEKLDEAKTILAVHTNAVNQMKEALG